MESKLLIGILFLRGKAGSTIADLTKYTKLSEQELSKEIEKINKQFEKNSLPFEIKENGNKIRMTITNEVSNELAKILSEKSNMKLPKALLEVLTIIAYKQPTTKPDIERIRGVSCEHSIRKLIEFDLIKENGNATTPGNPFLYITTNYFLELFDLKSIKHLPKLDTDIDINTINSGSLFENE